MLQFRDNQSKLHVPWRRAGSAGVVSGGAPALGEPVSLGAPGLGSVARQNNNHGKVATTIDMSVSFASARVI